MALGNPRETAIALGAHLVASSSVAASKTGDTVEAALATVQLPAIGPNATVVIVSRWSMTNSANNKNVRHRIGGLAGTIVGNVTYTTNANAQLTTNVANRGAQNSQYCSSYGNRGTDVVMAISNIGATGIDLTVPQVVAICVQLGLGTETATLEGYEVWILPG